MDARGDEHDRGCPGLLKRRESGSEEARETTSRRRGRWRASTPRGSGSPEKRVGSSATVPSSDGQGAPLTPERVVVLTEEKLEGGMGSSGVAAIVEATRMERGDRNGPPTWWMGWWG
jgi:hypothetical protein